VAGGLSIVLAVLILVRFRCHPGDAHRRMWPPVVASCPASPRYGTAAGRPAPGRCGAVPAAGPAVARTVAGGAAAAACRSSRTGEPARSWRGERARCAEALGGGLVPIDARPLMSFPFGPVPPRTTPGIRAAPKIS